VIETSSATKLPTKTSLFTRTGMEVPSAVTQIWTLAFLLFSKTPPSAQVRFDQESVINGVFHLDLLSFDHLGFSDNAFPAVAHRSFELLSLFQLKKGEKE